MHPANLDVQYLHFHSIKTYFLIWFLPPLWPMGYLELITQLPNLWGFSWYLSVVNFLVINSVMLRKHTLYDSNTFTAQNMVCFAECFMRSWQECIFHCCWVECSINDSLVKLDDGIVQLVLLDPCRFFVYLFFQLLREECWGRQL